MSLNLSRATKGLSSSLTLQINAAVDDLRKKGIPVLSLGAGEPDFDTPPHIRSAAQAAMEAGHTRYTAVNGILPLRQAICRHIEKKKHLAYMPQDILVGAGAKQVLFEALEAILDPGDEVILPRPCWVSYPEMIRMLGGVPVFVDSKAERGFLPDIEALARAVSPRTKALIINSPNNPSGAVWPRKLLENVMQLAKAHDFCVISDEIYEDLLYSSAVHISPAALSEDAFRRTIVVSGFSKAYAMTGWRVGYAAGPQAVIAAMGALQSHASGSINTIAQYAALAALTESQACVEEMRLTFSHRRKLLLHLLEKENLRPAFHPEGAFYLLMDVRPYLGGEIADDLAFCELLLREKHVAAVPGSAFGAKGFIRLSYAAHENDIAEAVRRIGEFVRSLP